MDVIHDLREYLAAVTAALGVGLESCSWGFDPMWAYVALDRRFDGRDTALLWDAEGGWSLVTEESIRDTDLRVMAQLDGPVAPPAEVVAEFVATFHAEAGWLAAS
jgi:Family of unknown function (DUF6292)